MEASFVVGQPLTPFPFKNCYVNKKLLCRLLTVAANIFAPVVPAASLTSFKMVTY